MKDSFSGKKNSENSVYQDSNKKLTIRHPRFKKKKKKKKLSKPFQLHELCMLRGLETASCASPPAEQFLC